MKEANMDRRVRKTRRVLRQCLTTLLKEKKIQEITVREIAEMADINRGTFYLHYKDVYDLMEQIENELMAELEEVLNNWGDPDSLEAYSSFIVTGCIGVVQYWLDSGMREGPEHMAALTEHFILKGIGGLEKKEGIIDAAKREHGA